MADGKKVLGVIPARGGSKGLPGKNTKDLCGKPLIAWSILAGLQSKVVSRLVVSTDSEEIAKVARNYGADVPFMRPAELARDDSPSAGVILHALDYFKTAGEEFDFVMMIEPTSPLRTAEDLDRAMEVLWKEKDADAIVGVARTESQNPAFLLKMDDRGFIQGYENKTIKVLRRQDIASVYYLEGSVYISRVGTFREKSSFYHEKTLGFEFPKWKALEIDDIDDFIMVEALMRSKGYGRS